MRAEHENNLQNPSLKVRLAIGSFLAILVMTTLWVYRFVPTFEFLNLDDHLLIFQDYSVRHFDWQRAFISPSAGLYHPLTTLTFLLENLTFGLNPTVFHTTNLILHILNVLLVYVFAQAVTRKRLEACWLAAFFALSPLSVESVAWVAERKDVLSTFFFLLSCLTYRKTFENDKKVVFWMLTSVFSFCAYLSKPSTVVLPAIFLWIDRVENRPFTRKSILEKVPFFVGSTAVFVVNWHVQNLLRGHPSMPEMWDMLMGPWRALAFYLAKPLNPLDLSISYPTDQTLLSRGDWITLTGFLIALLWTAWDRTYRRSILLSGAWFGVTLVPMLKIVPFGDQSPVNDRFLYLAGLGFAYALGTIWQKIFTLFPLSRRGRSLRIIVPVAFLGFYAYEAHQRTLVWRSTETVWLDTLKTYAMNGRAHANLARYYQSIGKVSESILHFQKAIELNGDKIPVLLADLAYLHIENNRDKEARDLLEKARLEDPSDPRVLNIEGVYLWRRGDIASAESKLRDALAKPPGLSAAEQRAKILNNLGLVLAAKGDFTGAMDMYQKALDLQPDVASTVYNLGLVYLSAQRLDDAIQTFSKAITIDPQLAEAWADLGVTYFAKFDLEKSAYYLKTALEKDPSHIRARRNLSIVLTKLGRCLEAQNLMLMAPDGNGALKSWPEEVTTCSTVQ